MPEKCSFPDGSVLWDIYSLAAIIMECDIGSEHFDMIVSESNSAKEWKKYLANDDVCPEFK
jgi:hypothetical protein